MRFERLRTRCTRIGSSREAFGGISRKARQGHKLAKWQSVDQAVGCASLLWRSPHSFAFFASWARCFRRAAAGCPVLAFVSVITALARVGAVSADSGGPEVTVYNQGFG